MFHSCVRGMSGVTVDLLLAVLVTSIELLK
jgi:hypothetical protein